MGKRPNPEDYKGLTPLEAHFMYMSDCVSYEESVANSRTRADNAARGSAAPVASSSRSPQPSLPVSAASVARQLPAEIRQVVDGVSRAPQNPRTGWPVRSWLGEKYPKYFSKKGVLRKKTALHYYRNSINWDNFFWDWLEDSNASEGQLYGSVIRDRRLL